MRCVVTGENSISEAVVRALLARGDGVRLFGQTPAWAARFEGARYHPGHLATAGSIEPVLAEREALIHAACLDAPGSDKVAHHTMIERGTLYARYGAERELLDHFVHVTSDDRKFAQAHQMALEHAQGSRHVHTAIVHASSPEATASAVLAALDEVPTPGRYPGRETDAIAP